MFSFIYRWTRWSEPKEAGGMIFGDKSKAWSSFRILLGRKMGKKDKSTSERPPKTTNESVCVCPLRNERGDVWRHSWLGMFTDDVLIWIINVCRPNILNPIKKLWMGSKNMASAFVSRQFLNSFNKLWMGSQNRMCAFLSRTIAPIFELIQNHF